MTVRVALSAVLTGVLATGGLAGCGTSPEAGLRDAVADATSAANERDADELRSSARRIADLARAERSALGAERADRLTALAASLDMAADQIDPAFLDAQRRARAAAEREAQRRADELAAQRKAAEEQAAREQAAREQAAREQAAREQAAREQAEQVERDRRKDEGTEDEDAKDEDAKDAKDEGKKDEVKANEGTKAEDG